ncbi:Phosphohydrolase (MutT/nudix family protein) [Giardia duodenalis assemblage B]|uniref:Phosphohydrolase (MutT/nudix family protein) n=1 Tax=Giardia duodenalis assemblage B TaxID=1394984 RepID=A0A132NWG3_GIAIN|nr:Phosphohydrolase (MutT/nudix family protein) [Giardia intestinalis assemblage B]
MKNIIMSKTQRDEQDSQVLVTFASTIAEKEVIYRFYNLTALCKEEANWHTLSKHIVSLFFMAFYYVLDNYKLLEDPEIAAEFQNQRETSLIKCFLKAYLSVMRERAFFESISDSWESFVELCLKKLREHSKLRINGEKAALIILNQDLTKVLLVRGQFSYGPKYSIPKGGLEDGEDSTAASLREAYEETQLYLGPFLWDPYCYYHQDLKAILPMNAWGPMPIGPYDFLSGQTPLIRSDPVTLTASGYHLHFAPGVPDSLLEKAEALCSSEIAGCNLIPVDTFCKKKWAQKSLPVRQADNIESIKEVIEKLERGYRKLPPLQQLTKPAISDWTLISLFTKLCA